MCSTKPPSWIKGVLLLKGVEGTGKEREGREKEGEGEEGEGEEREEVRKGGGEGRGGEGHLPHGRLQTLAALLLHYAVRSNVTHTYIQCQ